ncbi:NUDIX domain protein [Gregarina niphandrodes]|uniref:NUDIX domain protein n=1 Tax=Gregarina niphandrodes TaxID=110365 RepID=A0A023AYI3_GRENI|nr:NUDIX domain protein [Gregarina niphandrodes]EZG43732.1 NUDIX domain protein [Gregarina niphandrodes]|eukprot:XP_011133041.1 NUDIX domain protein [Gregarina niphandrodes]
MRLWSILVVIVCLMVLDVSAARNSVLPRTKKEAQRAFVVLLVQSKGVLLMVADKKSKGLHYQLPGGRVDEADFKQLGIKPDARTLVEEDMIKVARIAAAREIFEETGFTLEPEKLQYISAISEKIATNRKRNGYMRGTQLPSKLYFTAEIPYEQFLRQSVVLSSEHIGYVLEPNYRKVPDMIKDHSGGDNADAFKMLLRETGDKIVFQ